MNWQKFNRPANIFLIFLTSFLCGVLACSVWELGNIGLHFIFLLASFLFVLVLDRRKWLFLLFCFWGLFLGIWRAEAEFAKMDSARKSENFSGQAVVSRVPEQRESYQILVMRPLGENGVFNWSADEFQILTAPQTHYRYGEVLQISCSLESPQNKHEDFDYQRFLASRKIFRVCQKTRIEKTGENEGNFLLSAVFSLRDFCETKINKFFPLPESAYLAGLLLGGSERLPEDVGEQFQKTGMTHTVAASGYNITILASVLIFLGIFFGMWRQHAFWLALGGIVFFVLMIGAPASAVRASVMGGLVLWAAKKGRIAGSFRAIVFAAAVMVFNTPMALVYDVGFQLSFLATLGIVEVYGPLSDKFFIKNDFLELKSIFLTTISAQLGVMGVIIYAFESFSPISLVANLLILPLIPLIMLGGVVVILASLLFPFLAKTLASLVWLMLHWEIQTVEALSEISWASVPIRDLHWSWFAGYYAFFVLFVVWLRSGAKKQKYAMLETGD